jgi:carbon-monoxide dehydrogenase large subunit
MPGYIGQPLTRREDRRLVTGGGRYVSDLTRPGMLHLAVVRSPHAHARIVGRDYTAARATAGVVGVYGPDELGAIMRPFPVSMPDPRLKNAMPTVVADGVVRYVGEPVAMVLAENRYVAEDAAELVQIDYDPLPAMLDPTQPDAGPVLHPNLGTNLVAQVGYRVGDGESALHTAAVVARRTVRLARVVAHPMEPRGVLAEWDPRAERLTVWAATQGVWGIRAAIAELLQISRDQVQVIAPDVGGGFGVKNRLYPEDAAAVYLALTVCRPIKWAGDRREEFLATNQERDQVHEAAIGVDREGRIVAVVDRFVQDNGAYTHSGLIVPNTTAICIPGPYRVPHLAVEGQVVLTNKVPIGPYRGAGRPQATFVMERLLDAAADALHMDRVEIRRRNLVQPDDLPWSTGVPGRDGSSVVYHEGDFPACMEEVVNRLPDRKEPGLWSATAVANYMEMSAGAGFEGIRLTLTDEGRVRVAAGSAGQGQGHQITLAQIAADHLAIPIESIEVVEGDTRAVSRGIGTFGSRTVVLAGNGVAVVAPQFRDRLLASAARVLEAAPGDLVWQRDGIEVKGVPARRLTLPELARRWQELGETPLQAEGQWGGEAAEWGMGTHGVRLTVDPETLEIRITDYIICHDAGRMVNPLLVRGQTIGGTIQAVGQALWEELFIDEIGQPLNTTFMDYRIPEATGMPDLEMYEQEFRSSTNPEGYKGIGEGGVMPPMAVILSALELALKPAGIQLNRLPITPPVLFETLAGSHGGEGRLE